MKIKHLIGVFGVAAIALASCDNTSTADTSASSTTTPTSTTEVTSSTTESTPVATTTTDTTSESTPVSTTTTETTTTSSPSILLDTTEVIMVGDSTMTSFNDPYYYPRYGYGTQMSNYFDSKATFNNLALSGRSSLSFLSESNYTTMKNALDKGDYLVIGFGHNDEKSDEPLRYRSANYSTIDEALADENSFASSLYNNYIKVAQDAGATPILATPITRLDSTNSYTGSVVHDTKTGDYAQTIRDLGAKYGIDVIDLTTATATQYKSLGYDEAQYYHAMKKGVYTDDTKTEIVVNLKSVDATHLNIYGAKYVAYTFADLLCDTTSKLKDYVLTNVDAPTKAKDLVCNPSYVPTEYEPVDWTKYSPATAFATTTEGIYATAFGNTGGDPVGKGFTATETSSGVFKVGQTGSAAAGKITSTSIGMAYAFKQISIKQNYQLTVNAKVVSLISSGSQIGFGLMIRDDCYTPVKDETITSNCVCAGVYGTSSSKVNVNFAYVNDALEDAKNYYMNGDVKTSMENSASTYAADTTATFTISKVGQTTTIITNYLGTTYTASYSDFDYEAIDNDYYYLGMFATRGTIVEFTNVEYTYLGESQGA